METKIREFLKRSYSRIVTPDPETGRYAAQILEFSGCFSEGKTPQQAYKNLERAAYNWLESAIKQGTEIPEPLSAEGYSGKVALRMPKGLHRQAAFIARRDGISLNQFLVSAISSAVGTQRLYCDLLDRLQTVTTGVSAVAQFRQCAQVTLPWTVTSSMTTAVYGVEESTILALHFDQLHSSGVTTAGSPKRGLLSQSIQ